MNRLEGGSVEMLKRIQWKGEPVFAGDVLRVADYEDDAVPVATARRWILSKIAKVSPHAATQDATVAEQVAPAVEPANEPADEQEPAPETLFEPADETPAEQEEPSHETLFEPAGEELGPELDVDDQGAAGYADYLETLPYTELQAMAAERGVTPLNIKRAQLIKALLDIEAGG